MKIEKGQPGYLRVQKTRYLLWAVVEFAVVAAVFILGYVQTGKKENLFTVVAIVGCLPAAKMLVEFITMMPYKSIEPEKYREIEEKAPLLTKVYDLVITGNDKVMPVDVLVISDHTVCGYTGNEKTDDVKVSRYLKEMLHNNRLEKITVKVFHDYTAFLARAEGMNNVMTVEQSGDRRRERKIRQLILTTSI